MRVTLNGQPLVAGVSAFDRGLHYGDGLFETIVCQRGRARFLSLHLERLAQGCERLRINLGDVEPLRTQIGQIAASAGEALVKVIVTRGEAVARGYGYAGTEVATQLVFQYPLPPQNAAASRDGIRAVIAKFRYGESPALAGLKHLNRLEQVLARSEVPVAEAEELLVFSHTCQLISGTMSNVFIAGNGRVLTPKLDYAGVAGIMRRVILREALAMGIPAMEGAISDCDLGQAEEIFVSNARVGIWPVRTLGERQLGVGPITRRLQARLAAVLESVPDA